MSGPIIFDLALSNAMRLHFLALCAALSIGCSDSNSTDTSIPDDASRLYIDAIVPHHQLGLAETDEAIAKAVHPGLVTLAQRTKDDQASEIAIYKAERARLYGSESTPPPPPMQPIPASPVFDSIWLANFAQHHQTAINSSLFALDGQLTGGALSPVIDSLARHVVDEQGREQGEFMDSIAVWYGEPQP